MANLGAINKLFKIQRHLFQLNAFASNVLAQRQQQFASVQQKLLIDKKCVALGKRASSTTTATLSSIEDFRKREEEREKEFEQAAAEEERRQKKTENDAEEEAKRNKVHEIRTKILEAAMAHVPTLGWSRNAIVRGAEEAGLPSVVHGMFPEGGYALVSYFYGKCNEQLVAKLQTDTDNGQKKVPDAGQFVFNAIRTRLEMVLPYKSQWPQAIALMANPQNAPTALAQVLTLVDDICYYAGDRSVDMRWYARRVGVATIMKMTELFMLQDNSPDHIRTWEFLQSRLDEAIRLQTVLKSTEGVTHNFQRSFNSAFETARNILGIGYRR